MTQTALPQNSQNSALASIKGHVEPRIWTPARRELTPETSYGFKVIQFAELIGQPLDEWQKWQVIHMGELATDGKPVLNQVVLMVARQNGKSHLLKVLTEYWMFVECHPLILGMNTNVSFAKDAMLEVHADAEAHPLLKPLVDRVLEGNNDVRLTTKEGSTYRAVAATRKGGRGKRPDRVIVDELREHRNWDAYNAIIPAMGARMLENPLGAQAIFATNQGDDTSVVLDSLRASAVEYIEKGTGDDALGLFEWSAPDGADVTDPEVWAYANPSMNVRLSYKILQSAALRATTGPQEEAGFKTEHLCIKVRALDPAFDAAKWSECFDKGWTLRGFKLDVFSLDIAYSQKRATLYGAVVLPDGRIRGAVVQEWVDENALSKLDTDVVALLKKHKPRVFTWMPIGPAAAKSSLKTLKVPGVQVQEIRGDVADACMELADEIKDLRISHYDDALVNSQLTAAAKKPKGTDGRWVITRAGQGDSDAVYALAGAVHAARLLPPKTTMRLVGPDDEEDDE